MLFNSVIILLFSQIFDNITFDQIYIGSAISSLMFASLGLALYQFSIPSIARLNKLKSYISNARIPSSMIWLLVTMLISVTFAYFYSTFLNSHNELLEILSDGGKMQGDASPITLGLVVLLVPVSEEIIFRKLLFTSVYRKMSFFWSALVTSIIFVSLHPTQAMPAVFVLSICTCWLYRRTENLVFPIILHILHNLSAVLIALFLTQS